MADDQIVNIAPAPAAQAPQSIPVAPAPSAPAPDVAPVAVVAESVAAPQVVTPTPTAVVTEAAPVAPAEPLVEKAPLETLLAEPVKTPVAPVAEVAPVVAPVVTENTEGGQTEEPAPPPVYEPFVVPENTKLDDTKVSEFTKLLSGLELDGKADHATVQQFGQKAVDFHIAEVNRIVEADRKALQDTWTKQKQDWKDSFLKDPDIGGNRWETTVTAARNFISNHGGTSEQQAEFRTLMEATGLGNHPAVIRLLANAYRDLSEGTPLAATRPTPGPKSKTKTMYGGS